MPAHVQAMRVPLDSVLDPLEALAALRQDVRPFALVGEWAGGGAVLGSDPLLVADSGEDPFALLADQPAVADDEPGGVCGGWFGYLGYGLGERLERLPPAPPCKIGMPPFALAFYDHVLRLDAGGRWWFEALWDRPREHRLATRLEQLRARMLAPPPPARAYELGAFTTTPGRGGHSEAVAACRRYIAAGDLLQANLCLRLEAGFEGDALDLFTVAAGQLRPDRGAYVCGPWGAVASMSPELFLSRHGHSVLSAPIKGTRPHTQEGRAELLASAKDRAENVMIVDLMRNDIGRSCEYGTVEVPALAEPVAGPGVWHLVSQVAGTLEAGATDADLVRGAFPPGSVTGAPKIQAMRTIAALESTRREVYTGAVGFASPVAGLELNVAIRTFEIAGGRAWLGAGGGITWGSDPEDEYRECLTKARPLIAAAGAALDAADAPREPLPAPPTRHPRPDPARGVFATLLALDGVPVLLEEHLALLAASVTALWGSALPDGIEQSVRREAARAGTARVRVEAVPGAAVAVSAMPVARGELFPAAPADLRPLVLPGGLGSHKWIDRDLMAGGVEALVIDLDGHLLETGSGNLFVVEGDVLVTPAADGRLRAGVTRASVIAQATGLGIEVREEPVPVTRARAADALFRTSAIRGLQSVARCEGVGEWQLAPPAERLAAGLLASWGGRVAT